MAAPDILLVVFNRPEFTERVLDRLLADRTGRILVAGDGPRDAGDEPGVEGVRKLVRARKDPRIVEAFSDVNLGLRNNVVRGVDRLMAEFGRGVVIEDDVMPSRSFFPYMEALLERFADDDRIGAVGGQRLVPPPVEGKPVRASNWPAPYDYGFSSMLPPWGWGTWARAWDSTYLRDPSELAPLLDSGHLEQLLGLTGAREWRGLITQLDEIDSYWLRWSLGLWLHHRLAIVPRQNLVHNFGLGDSAGTLTAAGTAHGRYRSLPADELSLPLQHPPHLGVRNARAEQAFAEWVIPVSQLRRVAKRAVFDGPVPAARALGRWLGWLPEA